MEKIYKIVIALCCVSATAWLSATGKVNTETNIELNSVGVSSGDNSSIQLSNTKTGSGTSQGVEARDDGSLLPGLTGSGLGSGGISAVGDERVFDESLVSFQTIRMSDTAQKITIPFPHMSDKAGLEIILTDSSINARIRNKAIKFIVVHESEAGIEKYIFYRKMPSDKVWREFSTVTNTQPISSEIVDCFLTGKGELIFENPQSNSLQTINITIGSAPTTTSAIRPRSSTKVARP